MNSCRKYENLLISGYFELFHFLALKVSAQEVESKLMFLWNGLWTILEYMQICWKMKEWASLRRAWPWASLTTAQLWRNSSEQIVHISRYSAYLWLLSWTYWDGSVIGFHFLLTCTLFYSVPNMPSLSPSLSICFAFLT